MTIKDVAALAGVSFKTVSRLINDEPRVREQTRAKVRGALAELKFHPSLHARSLAERRSYVLGLVHEDPSADHVIEWQGGAMARCRDASFRIIVQSYNAIAATLIDEVIAMTEQTHVDGLIITPLLWGNVELIAALDARNLPFVRIAPGEMAHDSPFVEMDDEAATREMTGYLHGLGNRQIGFIAGHPAHHSSRLRLAGFSVQQSQVEDWTRRNFR